MNKILSMIAVNISGRGILQGVVVLVLSEIRLLVLVVMIVLSARLLIPACHASVTWVAGVPLILINLPYEPVISSKRDIQADCHPITGVARPENNTFYFHTELIPSGPYQQECNNLLKTTEEGKSYLYADCYDNDRRYDISSCSTGYLVADRNELHCSIHLRMRRTLVRGSYMFSGCDISSAHYNKKTDTLTVNCDQKKHTLQNISDCIRSGVDIRFRAENLVCDANLNIQSRLEEAAPALPPGGYLGSCRNVSYFPCLGKTGEGLLIAECRLPSSASSNESYSNAILHNNADGCSFMKGHEISNESGTLMCNPNKVVNDAAFQTTLRETFRCKNPVTP